MTLKQIFKNVLVPCAAGMAIKNGHTYGANCAKRADEYRPSELPIYSDACCICREQKKEEPPTHMEEAVGSVRKELWVWQDNMKGYRQKFVDVCSENIKQMKGPGKAAHDKCSDRSHLENSLDDSCYPSLSYPEEKFTKTRQLKSCKPPHAIERKPKKSCLDRCSKLESCKPKSEPENVCWRCQQRASGYEPQK